MYSFLLTLIFVIIPLILVVLPYLFSSKEILVVGGKIPFECGFETTSSQVSFSPRFFKISVIFLVFDLEISLVIPFVVGGAWDECIWSGWIFFALMFLMLATIWEWNSLSLKWST